MVDIERETHKDRKRWKERDDYQSSSMEEDVRVVEDGYATRRLISG